MADSTAGQGPPTAGEPPRPPAGLPDRLGDFRILREVGRGGMGIVYEAEQISLGRRVALKVLPAHALLDERQLQRFQREAKAAARLHHTNIVPVYGVGHEAGLHFYVMQFIPGLGLDRVLAELRRPSSSGADTDEGTASVAVHQLLAGSSAAAADATLRHPGPDGAPTSVSFTLSAPVEGPAVCLPRAGPAYWRGVARIGLQVAEALACAHGQGVLHRDIKPANLLLDEQGHVWVADFGLAKAATDPENLTRSGDVLGTLRYLAPERFNGQGDARSDVYALGLTLYELLTRRPAFDESDRHQLIEQVLHAEPPRPRRLAPAIPRDLETVVLKATDRDPARRYQTADDLAADLRRFLDDRPVLARRVTLRERCRRWCRRNPVLAALTAAVLVVTVLGVAGILWQWRQAEVARAEALARAKDALTALAGSYTAAGLLAGARDDPGQAALWFAQAARLHAAADAPADAESDRVRAAAWGRAAQRPVRAFAAGAEWREGLAVHPGGQFLLTRDYDVKRDQAECRLWDLEREAPVPFPGENSEAAAAAWDAAGSRLAVGAASGDVGIFQFPGGEPVQRVPFAGRVRHLAFSADGRFLALAADGRARVWDCRKEQFATPELRHPQRVTSLALAPDGTLLATGSQDNLCRVFAVPAVGGKPLFAPVYHFQAVLRTLGDRPVPPTFLPGGKILTVFVAGRVSVLDARTGKTERAYSLPGDSPVYAVAVSPDRQYLALGGFEVARIWNLKTGQTLSGLLRHRSRQIVVTLAFSADGRTLATGGCDHVVRRWSVPDGQPLGGPLEHATNVDGVAFSPRGSYLITSQQGGLVRVWAQPGRGPHDYVVALSGNSGFTRVSRDGRYLLPAGETYRESTLQTARVYEADSGKPAGPALPLGGLLMDADFSPDGRLIAAGVSRAADAWARRNFPGRQPGLVLFWDWRTAQMAHPPLDLPSEPRMLAYRPDGGQLAALCCDGELVLVDPAAGKIVRRWQAHAAYRDHNWWLRSGAVCYSPDGRGVITYNTDEQVRVWDPDTGRLRYPALAHQKRCDDVQFSPDGAVMVTAAWDNQVRFWDVATGRPVAGPLPHPDWVFRAQFSPDGTRVLTACRDGMARLWDWRAGKLACPPCPHEHEIHAAALTPDGRLLLTAGVDATFRLWEARSGVPLTPPQPLPDTALTLAVTPDGSRALVGGHHLRAVHGFHLGDLCTPEPLDPDGLCAWGELLSGRRLQQGPQQGGLTNLTAEEWLERWRGFRERYPEFHTLAGN